MDTRYPDFYKASKDEREKILKEISDDTDYEVFEEIPFWFNGRGVIGPNVDGLFLISLEGNQAASLRISEAGEDAFHPVKIGDEIFFIVTKHQKKVQLLGGEIRAYNYRTGEYRSVFATDSNSIGGMIGSEDSLYLYMTDCKRYGLNENNWVYTLDIRTGKTKLLYAAEGCLYNSVGSDSRGEGGNEAVACGTSLYHLATQEGNAYLMQLDADGSDIELVNKDGCIDCLTMSKHSDTILMIAMYDMQLQEIYACDVDGSNLRQISHFNTEFLKDKYVAMPKEISVMSEGYEIDGWVLEPVNYNPKKTYPAVFDIHGGPKTVYGPVFYHEMQVWAGRGYFVFFCNPKGSDGRDNEFADIRGDYGYTDFKNLMDFTDAVLEAYPQIDKNRVCETGGSYGGFMNNWIMGHTDRFCCIASQRSISNWISFAGVSDIGPYFAKDQTAGDLYDDPAKMWEHSPLKYAKNAKTPALFIHSDEDYRCPLEQGLQMYSALVDLGVPARLCLFHGENHELSRSGLPKHRIRRLNEITNWFDTYSSNING